MSADSLVPGTGTVPRADDFKIRLKLHYQGAVRAMVLTSDLSWEAFKAAILAKLGHPRPGIQMEFEDTEDNNERVSLQDQTDYEVAISTARASAHATGSGGREGRLRIWCSERSQS
ncbi:hypothetical protein DAEQUDRAFT_813296 [Daedalea quercina L-15889]|uniref:PB1 domain-containing protein n=1 Tax=Daedalea quercina L-15889 TaxID=1314783 RepID=A0A165NEA7_9APHY|nr:hypothetical protein DAEQUDRAFT_813296 [Daedalea quercina L-15889]